jgi:uracil-DNA glycosylase
MKSLRRLQIDPLAVYGTLFAKCPVADPSLADPACLARVTEEIAIVAPKIIVTMGEDALYALDELMLPLAHPLQPRIGEIQQLTPQIAVLHVPNIDQALDDERAKRAFWASFRVLGDWYSELPPY